MLQKVCIDWYYIEALHRVIFKHSANLKNGQDVVRTYLVCDEINESRKYDHTRPLVINFYTGLIPFSEYRGIAVYYVNNYILSINWNNLTYSVISYETSSKKNPFFAKNGIVNCNEYTDFNQMRRSKTGELTKPHNIVLRRSCYGLRIAAILSPIRIGTDTYEVIYGDNITEDEINSKNIIFIPRLVNKSLHGACIV